jgi:hypothetical protein
MFDNIILGPICYFRTREELKFQCEDLFNGNWMPLVVVNKGEIFDDIKRQARSSEPILGIILSVGYRKLYEA